MGAGAHFRLRNVLEVEAIRSGWGREAPLGRLSNGRPMEHSRKRRMDKLSSLTSVTMAGCEKTSVSATDECLRITSRVGYFPQQIRINPHWLASTHQFGAPPDQTIDAIG